MSLVKAPARSSGRASKVERLELKFLQINLGRGKDVQDLLMQTAREKGGPMYCSLVSSKNGLKIQPDIRIY